MKKSALLILTVVMPGLLCLSSCKSREEKTIDRLENLSERVEENGDKFNVEEWNGIMKELEDISDDLDDCNFTSNQRKEVGRLQTRFYKSVLKNSPKIFSGALSTIGSGLKEGLLDDDFDENGLKEQFDELEDAFKDAMESFEDELNGFDEGMSKDLDNLSDELDKLGDELNDLFD